MFLLWKFLQTCSEEYWAYDLSSFGADLGGMAGILLGFSFLSIIQTLADTFCSRYFKKEGNVKAKRTKAKPKGQTRNHY
jgi:hypothetical protein